MVYKYQGIYNAIHYESDLYNKVRGEKSLKELMREAQKLGATNFFVNFATVEMLVYFIAKKQGVV